MNPLIASMGADLAVCGQGQATVSTLLGMRPARKASQYADPVSWLVLQAVEQALEQALARMPADCRDAWPAMRHAVGHLVVSDQCTLHTLREIEPTVPLGRVSPMKFSGANPGQVAGLTCQVLGFNGPSIVLSMPLERGRAAALTIARTWLRECVAAHVVISVHEADESGHRVDSTVVSPALQETTSS